MQLIIHRGTHQIGGSCVELATETTRIIADIGMPLENIDRESKYTPAQLLERKILPDVKGLYCWDKNTKPVDAVFISHAHLDHYGFLHYVNPDIPIYLSKGSNVLAEVNYYFKGIDLKDRRFCIVKQRQEYAVGDFTITPYGMDHSGFDALGILFEAGGKKVFYSGDFRAHGRKGYVFKNFLKDPPKGIDMLILEGTRIEDEKEYNITEEALRDKFVEEFKKQRGLIFIGCSSQSIDRMSMLYSACRRSRRELVIDPYTTYVLDSVSSFSKRIPQYHFLGIRVFCANDTRTGRLKRDKVLNKYLSKKIKREDIRKSPERYVVKISGKIRQSFANEKMTQGACLVYSMWGKYYEDEKEYWESHNVTPIFIHTSGHADIGTLKKIERAVDPVKIIPIHTPAPNIFHKYFGDKVVDIEDGVPYEV